RGLLAQAPHLRARAVLRSVHAAMIGAASPGRPGDGWKTCSSVACRSATPVTFPTDPRAHQRLNKRYHVSGHLDGSRRDPQHFAPADNARQVILNPSSTVSVADIRPGQRPIILLRVISGIADRASRAPIFTPIYDFTCRQHCTPRTWNSRGR